MLSLLLAAIAEHQPIHWVDLGLKTYLFRIGSFELRYYSLAYLAGILIAYWLVSRMLRQPGAPMAQRHADDLFFYCTLGVILGGRLGYATFYTGGDTGLPSLWAHPGEMIKLWNGGMSFHGGLIGTTLAMLWVSWRGKLNFLRVTDYVSVAVPFGMFFGRIANFINGELWGRPTNAPWGMVFPRVDNLPRHPSQLYQAALEGILLFAFLHLAGRSQAVRERPGMMTGLFLMGYAVARSIGEIFREPEVDLGSFNFVTWGQILSVPMFALGLYLALRKPKAAA